MFGKPKTQWRARRGLLTVVATLGLSAFLACSASPAGATGSLSGPTGGNSSSGYRLIVVGGSQAAYGMVAGLAALFNESPGCDLVAAGGTTQPLDYGCPGIDDVGGSLSATNNPANTTDAGEDGFTTFAQENPFNDVIVQVAPIGASNGIKELEDQNTHAPTSALTVGDVGVSAGSAVLTAGPGFPFPSQICTGTWYVTGADQEIPSGDTVSTPCSTSSITLTTAPLGSAVSGNYSVSFSTSASGNNVAPLDVASSARAPNLGASGDDEGLNFVAYAMDGISWIHWTEYDGTATPSASVDNLSVANLTSIWSNSSCTGPDGTFPTPNWNCYGGANAPIDVYWAQSGSGAESTWATLTGLSGPYSGIPTNHDIFQDETSSIIANDGVANQGANNAIFFYSYGNYESTCGTTTAETNGTVVASQGYCGAAPTGSLAFTGTTTLALGEIANTAVDEASIASQLPGGTTPFTVSSGTVVSGKKAAKLATGSFPASVLAGDTVSDSANCIPADTTVTLVKKPTKVKLSNKTTCASSSDTYTFTPPAPFPGDRLIYNVYSDGSNTKIAPSSLAALNAVSEDGFICKPSTTSDIDPNTGLAYRTEIDNIIIEQGFFPLPLEEESAVYTSPTGNGDHYGAVSLANPAWTLPAVTSGSVFASSGDVGGLNGSGYNAGVESGAPYNFPSGDQDTDDSAVTGSYEVGQPAASTAASVSAPIGYCLALSTDGSPQPS